MNLREQEQFYQMMTRLRANSRAASTKDDAIVTEIVNGLIVSKPVKKIEYISDPAKVDEQEAKVWNLTKDGPVLESKAASTQYETVVKKYDMGGSSTGEPIYQCGIHNFETKNLKEFKEHEARLPHDGSGSKAASVPGINKLREIHNFTRSNGRIS